MKRLSANETLVRYCLLQIPGLTVIGFILWMLLERDVVSFTTAALIWLGWLVKDIVMYPFVKDAYSPNRKAAREKLIGERGVVVRPLSPRGFVRVRGELWQAELVSRDEAGGDALPEGTAIRVHAAGGMCLQVERARDDDIET